jgi:HlyD family secretion protein/epimerase transport system membrane fusion protein
VLADKTSKSTEQTGEVVEFGRGADQSAHSRAIKPSYQPGSPYKVVLIGAVIVLVAFVGLGTWAALAPLDSAALAPGTVTVESNRKVVQHPEGGVIREISVAEGDRVREGDPLVRLDPTEPQANFDAVRQKLNSALARRARLTAERANKATIEFPQELVQQAGEGGAQARQVMATARNQFRQRRQSLQGRTAIQRERISQIEQKIAGLKAERSSNERQVAIMQDELAGLRELYEKGYYPRTRILEMERELARLDGQIGSTTASIAQARNSISEARLQIEQLRQEFNQEVARSLSEVEDQVAELRQQLVVAAQKLERTAIRAPQDGVVQDLTVHTVGGVVRAGEEIMQVIPVQDRLIIEAEVTPRDIDIVEEGQNAEVRMSALSGRTTPTLIGTVTHVSADRVVAEQENGQSRSFYKARVESPPGEMDKLGTQKLQAGMPAEVLINTGEQTVLDYLVRPITDAMARGFIEP